jgi:hypothetical protein
LGVGGFEFFLLKAGRHLKSRPRALESYDSYTFFRKGQKTALPLDKNAILSGAKCSLYSVTPFLVLGLSVPCTRQVVQTASGRAEKVMSNSQSGANGLVTPFFDTGNLNDVSSWRMAS